jgi:hypothetical protein
VNIAAKFAKLRQNKILKNFSNEHARLMREKDRRSVRAGHLCLSPYRTFGPAVEAESDGGWAGHRSSSKTAVHGARERGAEEEEGSRTLNWSHVM